MRTYDVYFLNLIFCTDYRGPKDPIHGDAFNQAVRQAATEAMEAIFQRNEQATTTSGMLQNFEKMKESEENPSWSQRIGSLPGYFTGGEETTGDYANPSHIGTIKNMTGIGSKDFNKEPETTQQGKIFYYIYNC